uniref:Metallo-beta-lactamase domain-containing protein n=1 Tax=Bionectria ochroleuca TaxID=29856 RepID=A0A8H7N103_BIOOC
MFWIKLCVYRSRSLMQSYNLYHADTPVAVSGSQNISFSFDSGELTQRIDRKFPPPYWSWATPSNDDFDHSLVVHGGENGFACYIRGNNQVWLPTNLASGYTDAALAEYFVLHGNMLSPKLLLQVKMHNNITFVEVEINGASMPAVYDPVFDITIIFDSSSHLPTSYKTVEGIKFPHIVQTVYNSSTQKLDAVIEDYIIEEIAVNPGFPNDFFSGLPEGEGFFPKTAPRKIEGFTHDRITEFSSNGLWSGLTNSTVDGIKHDQPVPGLPNTHWLTLDDDALGVKQLIIEFEDHVIVGDAPPQWTKEVILWIEKNIQKPIKYLWPTHHHRDHSGGASQYVKLGAKLIVPEVAAKYWASIPNAELILFNETHPYVHSDNKYQAWFLWEKEATHAIDFSYAFITEKCPTGNSDVAVFEADVWFPGTPDAQNDRQLMREWLHQVDKDGVPDNAYVLPTHGQVRHLKELAEHAAYVYPPKV